MNHCGDLSDESICQSECPSSYRNIVTHLRVSTRNKIVCINFSDNKSTTLLGLDLTWFVLVSVSFFLAIGAVMAGFVICICRQSPGSSENQMQCKYKGNKSNPVQSKSHFQLNIRFSAIDMNGSTKYMHKLHANKSASLSGNLHHPANKHGYTQLLSMVTEHQRTWHLTIY